MSNLIFPMVYHMVVTNIKTQEKCGVVLFKCLLNIIIIGYNGYPFKFLNITIQFNAKRIMYGKALIDFAMALFSYIVYV